MSDLPWVDEIETRTHADRQYISFRPDLALIQARVDQCLLIAAVRLAMGVLADTARLRCALENVLGHRCSDSPRMEDAECCSHCHARRVLARLRAGDFAAQPTEPRDA